MTRPGSTTPTGHFRGSAPPEPGADPFFPSPQVCPARGFGDGPKPLHVRERTCGECGTVHDLDHNASHNVPVEAGP
ncbi:MULTISPECIES: zinc ribbon domain-containing protein [Streptomyces]|uniref:zinc ribbon domain-containing protein n=1 Tax=Streptomyces TaxID=1883 RepID=UPI003B64134B